MIWRCALRRQRIIRLHLFDPDLEDPSTMKDRIRSDLRASSRALEKPGSYSVTMCDSCILSKFLRVCNESRQEVYKHYRARIPCRYLPSPGLPGDRVTSHILQGLFDHNAMPDMTPGVFYFSPEWDFLHIICWPTSTALLPPFLHDLKTRWDLHGRGLLNLVIPSGENGDSGGSGGILSLELSTIHPNFRESVKSTLEQLHEVFFEDNQLIGRINPGDSLNISSEYWFNRSVPLNTGLPTFDRFPTDPRPISGDLKRQYMDTRSCRDKFGQFQRLLFRFKIAPDCSNTQFRIMLAHHTCLGGDEMLNISSRDGAKVWLEKDYERWWVDRSWAKGEGKKIFESQQYVMDSEPAFGFWLFPIEVVAMLAESSATKRVFDMRCYAPELGLAVM
jgi:hypothetical protein